MISSDENVIGHCPNMNQHQSLQFLQTVYQHQPLVLDFLQPIQHKSLPAKRYANNAENNPGTVLYNAYNALEETKCCFSFLPLLVLLDRVFQLVLLIFQFLLIFIEFVIVSSDYSIAGFCLVLISMK